MITCAFLGHLIELQKRLPHSLENEVLLCNVSWENAIIWFKDLDVSEGIYVVYIIFDLNSDMCIPVHLSEGIYVVKIIFDLNSDMCLCTDA